ncbi:MAG: CHAP domain-containing protein, partial [Bacteroidetes bacterium]
EIGANNAGPDIAEYTGGKFGPWCAYFLSWAINQALRGLGHPALPPRPTAKGLASELLKRGERVSTPAVGDIVVWERGPRGGWQGHAGIVWKYISETDTLVTVEGNFGPYPSKVSVIIRPNGRWRTRLWRIVRWHGAPKEGKQ